MRAGKRKAVLVSVGFALLAIGVWEFFGKDSKNAVPHMLFYLILCLNTYFSIVFFSGASAPTLQQRAFDTSLALIYFFLALSVGQKSWIRKSAQDDKWSFCLKAELDSQICTGR
jgi:hypothetical protein